MNKKERRAYMRAWYKRHHGYAARMTKLWREKHPGYMARWLEKHPGYVEKYKPKKRKLGVIYARKRREKKGLKTEEYRKYYAKNPEKARAHSRLNYYVIQGKIKRSPCEVCGEKRKYYVHAHHDDYSKPLEVRWLCGIHHKEAHKNKH